MSKLTQKSCLTCTSFKYTKEHGCICSEKGFDKMFREKTWPSFNSDYSVGKLKTGVPNWCPKQQSLLLEHNPTAILHRKQEKAGLETITLNATCIRGLRSPFEKIVAGEKIVWINPELICRTLRKQLHRLQSVTGEGPFKLNQILGCPAYGITVFVFLNKKGLECKINSYFFAKWV